jgi:hypothetical protein
LKSSLSAPPVTPKAAIKLALLKQARKKWQAQNKKRPVNRPAFQIR